jgi:hypothetical protein
VKQRDLARHLTALRVGEFEVATGGGIWVAIREFNRTLIFVPLFYGSFKLKGLDYLSAYFRFEHAWPGQYSPTF